MKKTLIMFLALTLMLACIGGTLTACGGSRVSGTYTFTVDPTDVGGNSQHSAFLADSVPSQTNTLILNDDNTYSLEKKLDEEVGEYHRDKNAEELADILEVVFALADDIGCSREKLMEIYQHKHDARGGFSQRCFLISKTER